MAKKKSKTQKYKRNIKRKQKQSAQKKNTQVTTIKEKQIVNKDDVKYNVLVNKENEKKIKPQILPTENKFQKKLAEIKTNINKLFLKLKGKKKKPKVQQIKVEKKHNKKYEEDIELPKLKKDIKKKEQPKNKFLRFLLAIYHNLYIVFNAVIITTFIILIIGLIRIEIFENGTIIYIGCIILFLMTVAISYNKYLSGKIFTTILVAGMCFAIYQMQYTYDFIRNLNSSEYEYKTYYVVTFDNGVNKSIYNINNKKVGLLKENCINIERKLNTKLNKVKYIEYENLNQLFDDFYNQAYRAIIVNENQYKYMKNNIESTRKVKILYEFKANGKK